MHKINQFLLKLKNYEKTILFIPIIIYPLAILITYFKYMFFSVNILLYFNISQIILLSFPTFMYIIFIFFIGLLIYETFIFFIKEVVKLSKKQKINLSVIMVIFFIPLIILLYVLVFKKAMKDVFVRVFFLHSLFIFILLVIYNFMNTKTKHRLSFYLFYICLIYFSFMILVSHFSLLRKYSFNSCTINISKEESQKAIILSSEDYLFLYDIKSLETSYVKKELIDTIVCK